MSKWKTGFPSPYFISEPPKQLIQLMNYSFQEIRNCTSWYTGYGPAYSYCITVVTPFQLLTMSEAQCHQPTPVLAAKFLIDFSNSEGKVIYFLWVKSV